MSFDDRDDMLPRTVPQPAPFIEATAKPTVPEVSLLFDKETPTQLHPNRSILKGSHASNIQRSSNLNTTPTEPYNTWRWKNVSQQNGDSGKKLDSEMYRRPLRFDNQHRDDSNFRNVYQLPLSPLQQKTSELPSNVNFEKHCNYQNIEPVQSKNHQLRDVLNTPDQLNYLRTQPEYHLKHDNIPYTSNSVQHHFVTQRVNPNTTKKIPDFNQQSSQITSEPNRFEVAYNTAQNYHITSESQVGCEHQVSRGVYMPTVANEDNIFYRDKDFKLDAYQDFKTSDATNRLVFPPHHLYNTHDHSCNKHTTHHGVSNVQRCSPKPIRPTCNLMHNSVRCDSLSCNHTENQNFIKDMINIIQTQNVQILKLQDQIKQLIQLHSSCHRTKENVDVSNQFDFPNMHLGKGKRTKGCPSENLPIIAEHSDSNTAVFQNEQSPKVSARMVASDINAVQMDPKKLISPKNCCCDCKRVSTSPNVAGSSPRNSNLPNAQVGCNYESSPNSQRKSRPAELTSRNEGNEAVDQSFTLNEADLAIGTIAEQASSPTSSVHVDMQEYNSSSYEDSDSSESSSGEEDSTEPQVGWTFYNNVLGQVNNILYKNANPSKPPPDSFDAVRNATIEHFRKLGISFTDVDNTMSKKVTFDAKNIPQYDTDDKNETDITMHFNALAMQCLKDELGTRNPEMQDFMMCNVASGNANLSFATLRYLERYHLLPKNQDQMFQQQTTSSKESHVHKIKKRRKKKKEADPTWYQPRKPTTKNSVASKILDITTLKQQPKLL